MFRWKRPAGRIIGLTCLIVACAMCLVAEPQLPSRQSDQVVFLIDDSSSMTEPGFDPDRPDASRWELVQEAYPKWLGKLAPDALTGLVTVGGDCNASPGISMPVQLDRSQLQTALQKLSPNGSTKLNAVLESAPALFNDKITGTKRIVLLSDGLNTCAPLRSTCEIARDLHAKHGIIIDVVSMVTDPAVEQEFQCVASETGGSFKAPRSYIHLTDLHFGALNPWLYVMLALSFITLALAARIFYRQAIHGWGWATGPAVSAGTLLLIAGTLCAYIALFVGTGWPSMLLGLILLLGMIVSSYMTRQRADDSQAYRRPSATLLCGGILVLFSAFSTPLSSGQALPATCGKVVHGGPQYHHIIALDLSGSVAHHLPEMKLLIACYAMDFALPGEDVTLIAFGTDQRGSVKEIQTFTVPPNGSTEILNSLLDDIQVQAPHDTRTYYRPLADFINEFLKKVRLQPIILVVSDGLSDGYHDAATGQVNFREIPFESFGKHGIYSAPGMHGWRVAIDAGPSLDLSALFQHPIVKSEWLHLAVPLGPVLTPCLVDPQVYFEPDDRLVLTPAWNPLDNKLTGTLHISVSSECVTRLRSFKVQARSGQEVIDLGSISATPIGANPRTFTLPISKSVIHDEEAELSIQLVLDQGKSNRMVYPQKSPVTKVTVIPYWRAHGISAALSALALLAIGLMLVVVVRKYSKARQSKPQYLKTVGGYAAAIYPGHRISIGGSDCDIAVPEVPTRSILAFAEANGTADTVLLHPEEGVQIKLNGHTTSGSAVYHPGNQIQFACANGRMYELTLFKAAQNDMGFGTAVFDVNNKNHPAFRDDENAVIQTSHSNGFPI